MSFQVMMKVELDKKKNRIYPSIENIGKNIQNLKNGYRLVEKEQFIFTAKYVLMII